MSARQPRRIRPRPGEPLDAPFPTMSDCLRAVLRCLNDRPDRARLYQQVVDRRVREAQR